MGDSFTPGLSYHIERFDELKSTNSTAREWIRRGAPEGTVIVAERQTAGRGRQGRAWVSLPGALLYSLILRPRLAPEDTSRIGFYCCIAAALAAEEMGLDQAWLKWPNDLVFPRPGGHRAKWGGILVEAGFDSHPWAIAGIGLNIGTFTGQNPLNGVEPGSLSDTIGRAIAPDKVLTAFLRHFAHCYGDGAGGDWKGTLAAWRKRDWLRGRVVTIAAGAENIQGVAMGVDDRGALILDTPTGAVLVDAGEAHLHTD